MIGFQKQNPVNKKSEKKRIAQIQDTEQIRHDRKNTLSS